ncbi:unannotated protein [freshwater metagenome]|uniref:Unannotated protein n=1 Tax=freshwater metagenome TaxID=449393 RepID=A0A6J6GL87_9ZZZZ
MADVRTIVSDEKKKIASLCSGHGNEASKFFGRKELGNRRIEFATVLDAHPNKTLGTPALCLVGEFVELRASELCSPVDHDALDAIGLEGVELGGGKVRRELNEFHAEANIGLIGTETFLRLLPGHTRDIAHLLTSDFFDCSRNGHGNERENFFLRNEAGFGVELHEFELAIGTEVFVAQATSNLVVAIDTANHAQLLEQLWALRQGIERTRRQTAGDHEIPCPFRRGRNEHWSFDFNETLIVHGPPQRGIDLGANTEVALHALGTKIDIAMSEAHHFIDLDTIVELERWRLRDIKNLNAAIANFDLASGHVRVGRAIGALTNDSSNANYVFRTKVSGTIDHALHESGVITKIDKGQMLTVLTAAGYPPAHRDLAANVGNSQRSAMVGTHGNRISHRRSFGFRRVEQREQWQRSSERQLLVRCRRADHGSLRCRPRLRRHR